MVTINFDEIDEPEENSFGPIPKGWYRAEMELATPTETRNGNEMWKCEWRITKGQFAGQKIWDNLVFSPKALGRVKVLMRAIGKDPKGEMELEPYHLENKECEIHVIQEEYKGKTNNKIDFTGFRKPTAGGTNPFNTDEEIEEDEIPF